MTLRGSLKDALTAFVALQHVSSQIEEGAAHLSARLRNGGTVAFCGNGGSAAIAQHLAAELVGRFKEDRRPLPALSFTNASILTAIANDVSYEEVFARQVRAYLKANDILVAMSTSGQSANVLRAVEAARSLDVLTIGLTGRSPSGLADTADLAICVPATDTARIQECHLFIGHVWCEEIERRLIASS